MSSLEAVHSNDPKVVARIGDVVMAPGNVRAIVIAIEGTFVTILGIGTSHETGETSCCLLAGRTDVQQVSAIA